MIFWKSKIIKPIPNSTADSTKKKKVKEIIFKLSYIIPVNKTIEYKVIHNNSAVSNKWSAVFVLTIKLNKINI